MDPDDVARIYSEQRAFMASVAGGHVGPDEADDVVQDAAVRMMGQRKVPADERGWAYTLTDHAAHERLDYLQCACRDVRKTEYMDTAGAGLRHAAPPAEQTAITRLELRQAIREAPRAAVQNALGYTVREIAERQGRRVQSVTDELWRWESRRRE